MAFRSGPVRVSVPATSANLGPGFDALGLALELRDELVGEVTGSGLVVEVDGEGSHDVPLDEAHLVVRAMRAAFAALGEQPPGLRLSCHNVVPHARGLGSSASAIVGGLVLARALVVAGPERLDDGALLVLATRLEGHPDNVAPALLGGFTVAGHDHDQVYAVQSPVDPAVSTVAFIPAEPVSTEVARGLLPDVVPHRDAATNAARAALLVAALAGQPELLLRATEDRLHQRYREPAMPGSLALVERLREQGYAAVVSGAGPTVLVLTTVPNEVLGQGPDGWEARHLPVAPEGAREEEGASAR